MEEEEEESVERGRLLVAFSGPFAPNEREWRRPSINRGLLYAACAPAAFRWRRLDVVRVGVRATYSMYSRTEYSQYAHTGMYLQVLTVDLVRVPAGTSGTVRVLRRGTPFSLVVIRVSLLCNGRCGWMECARCAERGSRRKKVFVLYPVPVYVPVHTRYR